MAATSSKAVPGWTPERIRRSRWFAFLLLAGIGLSVWVLPQVWFAWATPGVVPGCDPVEPNSPTVSISMGGGSVVEGVAARGCIAGNEIVEKVTESDAVEPAVKMAMERSQNVFTADGPAEFLGYPRAVTALIACCVLAVVSIWAKRGWLGLIALFALQIPNRDLAALRAYFLNDNASFQTVPGQAFITFTYVMTAAMFVVLLATMYVLKVNYDERAYRRKLALENGEPLPAEPMDPFWDFVGRKVSRVRTSSQEATQQHVIRQMQE